MPRVEAYGESKVDARALPSARVQSSETLASSGALQGQALQNLGAGLMQATGLAQQMYDLAEDRKADVENLQTARRLNELDAQLTTDPFTGVLHKKGLEPMESREKVLQDFDAGAAELEKGIRTRKGREFLDQQRMARRANIRDRVDAYASAQLDEYELTEFKATMASAINMGIAAAGAGSAAHHDDNVVTAIKFQLDSIDAMVDAHAARFKLPPAAAQLLKDKSHAQVHVGVVERLLARDEDAAAKAYFDEARSAIGAGDAEQLPRLEAAIEEGTTRGKAQRAGDDILNTTTTLKDAIAKVKAIEDPKVRDQVQQRVEHDYRERKAAQDEAHDAMFQRAVNAVWEKGTLRAVPSNEFSEFTLSEKNGLQNILDEREAKATVGRKSNERYLAQLLDEMGTDPAKFVAHDNGEVIRNLSPADAEQYFRNRAALRVNQADDVARAQQAFAKLSISGTEVRNGMIDRALRTRGVDPRPPMPGDKAFDEKVHGPQNAIIDGFYRAVREAVTAAEQRKGGPIDDKEYQGIVDALGGQTGQNITLKDKWGPWNDTRPQLLFEGVPEVPAGELGRVVDALRQAGQPVTAKAVRDLYQRTQQRLQGQRPTK
jgi:hypothetical protein